MSLNIEMFRAGPLDTNVFLLWDAVAREAILVDPSIAADDALERTRQLGTEGIALVAIWNTHGHFDHIYDNARWKGEFSVPLFAHPDDEFLLSRLREQSLWFGLEAPDTVIAEEALYEGQTLHVGSHAAQVLWVPGHSPGSVAFYFAAEGVVIGGDVLFRGSIGRVDLPGGSARTLQESLQRLLALPSETQVLPGHGEPTTVAYEREHNPYFRYASRVPQENS